MGRSIEGLKRLWYYQEEDSIEYLNYINLLAEQASDGIWIFEDLIVFIDSRRISLLAVNRWFASR